jgi:hypothetical protein
MDWLNGFQREIQQSACESQKQWNNQTCKVKNVRKVL